MPTINMTIPHQLSPEEALNRIKNLLSKIKEEGKDKISDLKEEWSEYTGKFSFLMMSMAFSGIIVVEPNQVKLEGTIPLMAAIFKSKIEETIRHQAMELLRKP